MVCSVLSGKALTLDTVGSPPWEGKMNIYSLYKAPGSKVMAQTLALGSSDWSTFLPSTSSRVKGKSRTLHHPVVPYQDTLVRCVLVRWLWMLEHYIACSQSKHSSGAAVLLSTLPLLLVHIGIHPKWLLHSSDPSDQTPDTHAVL